MNDVRNRALLYESVVESFRPLFCAAVCYSDVTEQRTPENKYMFGTVEAETSGGMHLNVRFTNRHLSTCFASTSELFEDFTGWFCLGR